MGHPIYCDICLRNIYREHGRYNLEGVKPERAITTFVGVSVCAEHADELLNKVLEKPEEATTSELEQGFVMASQRTHPDLDDGCEW